MGFVVTAGVALLTALAAGLLLSSLYLVLLTAAGLLAHLSRRPTAGHASGAGGRPAQRFAVLVPAHNEALLIGRLLDNLRSLDYAPEAYTVHVVADNCDDDTATIARARGARVYERFDSAARGKGHALRWLLEQLRAAGERPDAYVILDADSVVAPNFLRAMATRLAGGSEVVQAYYSVLNAGASPVAALRFAALAAIHYLRPLGRSLLGLSCGLKGNGMCVAAPVLEGFAWRWFTLAEDVEFHLALVEAGIRVDFAPETWVLADMPVTLRQAASQNARWERGRLHLLRSRVPHLLLSVLSGRGRNAALILDAGAEQLIPPLSVPFALGGGCLLAGLSLGQGQLTLLAAATLAALVLHLLVALLLVRAPWRTYLALGYAPVYVCWKVGLYLRALLSAPGGRWIRTARLPRTATS
ncbi:MAG TPA: glycosyltransferase family 2 protein [Chloroflexota bacterium]|nr:glycosyltransferase family 2 protein [Chloroflexota bacterium]